jgi:hypothetical protein
MVNIINNNVHFKMAKRIFPMFSPLKSGEVFEVMDIFINLIELFYLVFITHIISLCLMNAYKYNLSIYN